MRGRLLQEEIEEKRLALARRGDRIALGVEPVFCGFFVLLFA
jgi:hypothetical protein